MTHKAFPGLFRNIEKPLVVARNADGIVYQHVYSAVLGDELVEHASPVACAADVCKVPRRFAA